MGVITCIRTINAAIRITRSIISIIIRAITTIGIIRIIIVTVTIRIEYISLITIRYLV